MARVALKVGRSFCLFKDVNRIQIGRIREHVLLCASCLHLRWVIADEIKMRPLNFFSLFQISGTHSLDLRVPVNMTCKDISSEKEEKVNSEWRWWESQNHLTSPVIPHYYKGHHRDALLLVWLLAVGELTNLRTVTRRTLIIWAAPDFTSDTPWYLIFMISSMISV